MRVLKFGAIALVVFIIATQGCDAGLHARRVAVGAEQAIALERRQRAAIGILTDAVENDIADAVFGQGGEFNLNNCHPLGFNAVCSPDDVAMDTLANLYVVDTSNERMLQYLTP